MVLVSLREIFSPGGVLAGSGNFAFGDAAHASPQALAYNFLAYGRAYSSSPVFGGQIPPFTGFYDAHGTRFSDVQENLVTSDQAVDPYIEPMEVRVYLLKWLPVAEAHLAAYSGADLANFNAEDDATVRAMNVLIGRGGAMPSGTYNESGLMVGEGNTARPIASDWNKAPTPESTNPPKVPDATSSDGPKEPGEDKKDAKADAAGAFLLVAGLVAVVVVVALAARGR